MRPGNEGAMLHLTLILCDTILIVTHDGVFWIVTASDALTGKMAKATWNSEQLAAILALGAGSVGEDETPGYDVAHLYTVAEKAIEGWPVECRPMP